jgi:DNA-binding transcriptional ArsR family regulator
MKAPRPLTDEGMELLARRFAVLGDPMRLKLLHALFEGEKSVNELVELSGTTQPNVSRHLQKLMHTGTVSRRKQGTMVYYAIADQTLFKLCELVCSSLEKQLAAQAGSFRRTG